MIHSDIAKNLITENLTIREALELFLKLELKILLCCNKEVVCGVFTDGDFVKIFRNRVSLESKVSTVMNSNFVSLQSDEVNSLHVNSKQSLPPLVPVLDFVGRPQAIFQTNSNIGASSDTVIPQVHNADVSLIVMAGGKGVRLLPLTEVIPKPLIPYRGRPIIDQVIEKYIDQGLNKVIISIGFMAEKFVDYFNNAQSQWPNVDIKLIDEATPQGTIGALSKICEQSAVENAIVAYADSIVSAPVLEIEKLLSKGCDLVLVVSDYKMQCAYGNVIVNEFGDFSFMEEKPTFSVNAFTGVYGISQKALALLSKNNDVKELKLCGILLACQFGSTPPKIWTKSKLKR